MVQQVGLVPTILGMGAIYLAVTLGMFFNPALRQMDVDTQLRQADSRRRPVHRPAFMSRKP